MTPVRKRNIAGGIPPMNWEKVKAPPGRRSDRKVRVEYMPLQHDHGPEAAHPIEILQTLGFGLAFMGLDVSGVTSDARA